MITAHQKYFRACLEKPFATSHGYLVMTRPPLSSDGHFVGRCTLDHYLATK